jgi:cobalt/nickel transport protein
MALHYKRLWFGLGVLLLLTPLGIILPERLGATGGWGEWSTQELKAKLGQVPRQLERLEGLWNAVFPDYTIKGMTKPWQTKLAYFLTGLLGAGVVVILCLALGKRFSVSEDQEKSDAP